MNIGGYNFKGPYDYKFDNFSEGYPCVYVVLGINNNVVYIGKTDNLRERMVNHHKKDCWDRHCYSSSSLYVLHVQNEYERDRIERELLNTNNTHCNEQLN